MHRTPDVGDRRGGNPRHERVSFVQVTQPQGVTDDVVAQSFESGQRAVYVGAERRSAPNKAGGSALASNRVP